MAKLNLTQAAQTAGIARGTLYRHINSGKLMTEENHQGDRVVDTAELLRVYGELSGNGTSYKDVPYQGFEQQETADNPVFESNETGLNVQLLQQENEHLKQQLSDLAQDKEERKKREETLQEENTCLVSIIEHQTLMLSAPAEQRKKRRFLGLLGR